MVQVDHIECEHELEVVGSFSLWNIYIYKGRSTTNALINPPCSAMTAEMNALGYGDDGVSVDQGIGILFRMAFTIGLHTFEVLQVNDKGRGSFQLEVHLLHFLVPGHHCVL
jgi:hypothetical protein